MALIYPDTAMLVDLLFIQAKQTEEGKAAHARSALIVENLTSFRCPRQQLQLISVCFQIRIIIIIIIFFLPAVESDIKMEIAACESTLKLPADKNAPGWEA